jgi:hypothetical protein
MKQTQDVLFSDGQSKCFGFLLLALTLVTGTFAQEVWTMRLEYGGMNSAWSNAVTWTGKKFVAAGDISAVGSPILSSDDGINWITTTTLPCEYFFTA